MRLFHHYSDLLTLLQCQSATNVTIVVQLCILKKNRTFGVEIPHQIIVKTAKFRGRGKTDALERVIQLITCVN